MPSSNVSTYSTVTGPLACGLVIVGERDADVALADLGIDGDALLDGDRILDPGFQDPHFAIGRARALSG